MGTFFEGLRGFGGTFKGVLLFGPGVHSGGLGVLLFNWGSKGTFKGFGVFHGG